MHKQLSRRAALRLKFDVNLFISMNNEYLTDWILRGPDSIVSNCTIKASPIRSNVTNHVRSDLAFLRHLYDYLRFTMKEKKSNYMLLYSMVEYIF